MNDAERHMRHPLLAEPLPRTFEHRTHDAFAAPRILKERMRYITPHRRHARIAITPQMHPQVAEQPGVAGVRHPYRMIIALEHHREPFMGFPHDLPVVVDAVID